MLLFNYLTFYCPCYIYIISIHLMLLFNRSCVYIWDMLINFNTSNVTIQLGVMLYKIICWFISIHLMLLFNSAVVLSEDSHIMISIHLMLLFNKNYSKSNWFQTYFNTSNVTIQHRLSRITSLSFLYFNTSNVTIQMQKMPINMTDYKNFNTSNVTIQLHYCHVHNWHMGFQYI